MFLALLGLLATTAQPSFASGMPAPGLYLNSEGSPLIPLLESVQNSLDIEIYTMQDPEVRSLLRSALSRGVIIRVVQEPHPYGLKCDLFGPSTGAENAECADEKKLVSEVLAAGGSYVPFNKADLCPNGGGKSGQGCYEHGKIVIADGQLALLSSGNFDSTNLCIASENPSRCDRDYTIISDDPQVVSTLDALMRADLAGSAHDPRTLIPDALKNTLTVSPYTLQPLVDFVNSATTSLDIETQYLHDPQLNLAIEDAARRGVRVNVTVSSACAFGTPTAYEVNENTTIFTDFDRAGISSAMFDASNLINGASGYLHAKAIIVDGVRAWMGSANGSNESLNENREYGIFFDDPADVQKLLGVIQDDHSSPDSETWEQSLRCEKDKASVGAASGSGESGDPGANLPTKPKPKPHHPKPHQPKPHKPKPHYPKPHKPKPHKPKPHWQGA